MPRRRLPQRKDFGGTKDARRKRVNLAKWGMNHGYRGRAARDFPAALRTDFTGLAHCIRELWKKHRGQEHWRTTLTFRLRTDNRYPFFFLSLFVFFFFAVSLSRSAFTLSFHLCYSFFFSHPCFLSFLFRLYVVSFTFTFAVLNTHSHSDDTITHVLRAVFIDVLTV